MTPLETVRELTVLCDRCGEKLDYFLDDSAPGHRTMHIIPDGCLDDDDWDDDDEDEFDEELDDDDWDDWDDDCPPKVAD